MDKFDGPTKQFNSISHPEMGKWGKLSNKTFLDTGLFDLIGTSKFTFIKFTVLSFQ